MYVPRIVIAGTHSGVGKTTISIGIMAALKSRQRPIQAYKVGPDYIDPSYHSAVTGKPSRNLDRWLLGSHLGEIFTNSSHNSWAIIEGVMGLFDGMVGTRGFGSTGDIAKELKAPVILIVDAASMGMSIAALVYGYANFDPEIRIAGVILNRVKSSMQEKLLRDALKETDIPVLGCIPQQISLKLPERHLGLIPAGEKSLQGDYLFELEEITNKYIDLNLFESIMINVPDYIPNSFVEPIKKYTKSKRIGIAWDEAFLFYYQDALDLFQSNGFILVPFSPLYDNMLPPDLDGLFIGGGFPELHLEQLGKNESIRDSIKSFALSGKPVYAECGGYMYLGEYIKDFKGKEHRQVGLIPMFSEMTQRLQGIGYKEGFFAADTFLGPKGMAVHGHEFHYSKVTYLENHTDAYQLFRGGNFNRNDGYARENIFASYLHLHFSGYPSLLENWFMYNNGVKND